MNGKHRKLKVAFVGSGDAARIHSRTLAAHFRHVDRTYVGRSRQRAQDLARRFGGRFLDGGLEAVLDDASIEVVFVLTPPSTHLDLTLRALGAGKHVVVEKPAFLDGGEFDHVARAADRSGRWVLVAENYYYKPLLERLRDIVSSGDLGQIRLVEVNAVKLQRGSGWRLDPSQAGGGALFEGGIHWISLLANLGLEIDAAHGFFPDAPAGHERSAVCVTEYAQGAVGVLSYSWDIPGLFRGLCLSRVWGTRGSVLFESNGVFLARTGRRPRVFIPGIRDMLGYRAMMTDFVGVLRGAGPPKYSLEMARRDVELVRSIYDSVSDLPHPSGGNQ